MTSKLAPVYLGWQFAPALDDPGPAPGSRAAVTYPVRFDQSWVSAQRTIVHRLARPAMAGGTVSAIVIALAATAWLTGVTSGALAAGAAVAAAGGGLRSAGALRRTRSELTAVIAAEQERVAAVQAAAARDLAASHRDHASDYRAWQRRKAMYDRQPSWFPVSLPEELDRLDVAGGTLAGWSALVTTIAATHLSLGGELTLVDLTEAAVGGDLIHLARQSGLRPLVWLLPDDLPRLDLGTGFGPQELADVLALAAGTATMGEAARHGAGAEQAADGALLDRVLGALGSGQGIARLTAALRVLGEIGDPRTDLRSGLLTADQLDRIGRLFGRGGAERMVIERAWALEARLRHLDALGTDPEPLAPSRLRVTAIDRRCGVIAGRTLGTYLVAAMTQVLRAAEPGEPWRHTLCVLGAERLGAEVIDRLTDACEQARTGLVIAYRSIPAAVRERLGRGNAAMAFMRLGNGDEAKAASELIGTEHRFVVGQLTDTVGTSVTDTWGDSYTSSVGTADSVSGSVSYGRSRGRSSGRGRSYQSGFAPFGDFSRSLSGDANYSASEQDSVSLTEGINSGTSWGLSTSRALGENTSLGRTAQRSREFLVEADELQRLPLSAAIISYPAPAGRAVLLADTNPALITAVGKDRAANMPRAGRGSRPD